ncbi:FtsX-like permease family protein [Actinotalea solisilvae]|uniref:FtsX-like permease family protein n=1 Tax=Actinotalea solisilvae TaxID=2072922 RepID=UPI0018F11CD7|nr:FtsX-like permease family protein [Actinotalea solisilvae]
MTRRSGYGAPALVRRQLAAEPGTAVLVAATVLVVAFVLSLWPRAVDGLLGEDTRDGVADLPADRRDLSTSDQWFPHDAPEETVGAADGSAAAVDGTAVLDAWVRELEGTTTAGPTLRSVLGEAGASLTRARDAVERGPRGGDVHDMTLTVRADAAVGERVRLVGGAAPAPFDAAAVVGVGGRLDAVLAETPMDVMVSADTAERMRWEVGEVRRMLGVIPFRMRLAGVFEAVDPDDGAWAHAPGTLAPTVLEDGDVGITIHGTAYADPSAVGALALVNGLDADRWIAVEPAAVAAAERETLVRELRAFLDARGMTSELDERLDEVAARHTTFATLLDMLALGPVGVAAGVLWLAAVLAAARRRGALGLAAARGGSGTGIRLAMAVQGLVTGLPAAALGAAAAALALPRQVGASAWVLPAAVGLAPAALLALSAGAGMRHGPARRVDAGGSGDDAGGARRGPRELTPAGRRRLRFGAEAVVVAVAVLAVVAVRQRGLSGGGGGGTGEGTDPLLLAAPVLLAVVGGLVAVRALPLPLRGLSRALHRRRGLPHFLGAAEATRSGAGLAAVVALVLGVAISVFSGVTWSTVRAGIAATAAGDVGADVRVDVGADGATFTPEDVAAAAAVPGVARVAEVASAGRASLTQGASSVDVTVLLVAGDALAAVQEPLPGAVSVRLDAATGDGAVPAVLAGGGTDGGPAPVPATAELGVGGLRVPLAPGAVVPAVPGVTSGSQWVVVDRAGWAAATGDAPAPGRLLVDLAPGADPEAAAAALGAALADAEPRVTTAASVQAALGDRTLVRGVTVGLLAAAALSGLLSVVVVVLALAVRAPERGRLVALLSTVGAPRGTAGRLVAWEVWPLVAVSTVVGAAVGVALPWLLLATADLRPFTAGAVQPPVVVDPTVLAVTGAGALATVVVAVALSGAVSRVSPRSRSRRAAVVLREGERP